MVRSRAGSGTRSTGPGVGVTAVMDHSKETYSSGLANLATALSNLGHSAGGGDGVARVIRSRHRAPDRRPARSPDRAPRRAGTDGPARAEAVALVFVGELNLDDDTPGVFVQRVLPLEPGFEKLIERRTVRPRPTGEAGS